MTQNKSSAEKAASECADYHSLNKDFDNDQMFFKMGTKWLYQKAIELKHEVGWGDDNYYVKLSDLKKLLGE
jgi:hypothetical protein